MRAGILRRTAVIQQPVKSRGTLGEQLVTWQDVATRRCALRALRGAEKQTSGDHVQAIQRWLVIMRYDSGVAVAVPEWRVLVDGLTLRITSIDNRDSLGNLDRELQIYCEANV